MFNKENMQDFIKKINNFLNKNDENIELISEPKIDSFKVPIISEEFTTSGNSDLGISKTVNNSSSHSPL